MMNLFGETPVRKLLTLHALSGETLVEATATPGNPCTFETDVAKALTKLVVPFADENGITWLTVWRTGKNLFNEQWEQGNIVTGVPQPSTTAMRSGFIDVNPSTSYYGYTTRTAYVFVFEYTEDGTYANKVNNISLDHVFTTGPTTKKIRIVDRNSGTETVNTGVNYPSTETSYEPYSGTTIPVTFPEEAGTVNSGSVDLVNGILTVTSPESKTVQIDPVSVTTLIGTNVIWSDANGNLEVKYMKKG